MNCQSCQKESDAYIAGKLNRDIRTQVETHLENCKECAEVYRVLKLAAGVIKNEKEIISNPFLSARVMSEIDNIENRGTGKIRSLRNILRPALITLSLAGAIFSGILIGRIYKPIVTVKEIPSELVLMDDALIESVAILSND